MALPILETDSLSNQNITALLEIGSYEAGRDSRISATILLKELTGSAANFDFVVKLTRGGVTYPVQYQKSIGKYIDTDTTFGWCSDQIGVASGDIITVLVKSSNAGDATTVDTICEFYDCSYSNISSDNYDSAGEVSLSKLNITAPVDSNAVTITGGASSAGIIIDCGGDCINLNSSAGSVIVGTASTSDGAIDIYNGGAGPGFYAAGTNSGAILQGTAGAGVTITGSTIGLDINGGSSSGIEVTSSSNNAPGITVTADGIGVDINSIKLQGVTIDGSGSSAGMTITGAGQGDGLTITSGDGALLSSGAALNLINRGFAGGAGSPLRLAGTLQTNMSALTATARGTGAGISATGGANGINASGTTAGITAAGVTNGHGLAATGAGTGHGFAGTGGATGFGMNLTKAAGATGGGLNITAANNTTNGSAVTLVAKGTGAGITASGGADGISLNGSTHGLNCGGGGAGILASGATNGITASGGTNAGISTSSPFGYGIDAGGVTAGIRALGTTNGVGLLAQGAGSGAAIDINSTNGAGIDIASTNGIGIKVISTGSGIDVTSAGDAISAVSTNGTGLNIEGRIGAGVYIEGHSCDGINVMGGGLGDEVGIYVEGASIATHMFGGEGLRVESTDSPAVNIFSGVGQGADAVVITADGAGDAFKLIAGSSGKALNAGGKVDDATIAQIQNSLATSTNVTDAVAAIETYGGAAPWTQTSTTGLATSTDVSNAVSSINGHTDINLDAKVSTRAVAGDKMDIVNVPNSTAVTAIQNGLATSTNVSNSTSTTATNINNAVTALETYGGVGPWSGGDLSSLATKTDITNLEQHGDDNWTTADVSGLATSTEVGDVKDVADAISANVDVAVSTRATPQDVADSTSTTATNINDAVEELETHGDANWGLGGEGESISAAIAKFDKKLDAHAG